ncbi:hypothetical protein Dimus_034093, partial [Dionaea muscipula]
LTRSNSSSLAGCPPPFTMLEDEESLMWEDEELEKMKRHGCEKMKRRCSREPQLRAELGSPTGTTQRNEERETK